MPKYTINTNKTYDIPKEIKVVKFKDYFLVISPLFANWIVLDSENQLAVFYFFVAGNSIAEALGNEHFDEKDVTNVVTQIEAKKFCCKETHSSSENERSMHLYLTNRCNLSCPHCYMFSGKANANELTTDEILRVISDYRRDANGKSITLSGGEPTLHVDFDSIVRFAAEIGLEVKVLTNGTLMLPERIDKLAKYLHSVQISIDGFSEVTNSTIRGNGNFEKAILTVDLLVKHGIDTSIAITPPIEILKIHVDEYVAFAQELSNKYYGKSFRIKFAEELLHGRRIDPSMSSNEKYFELMKEIEERLYGPNHQIFSFVDILYNNSILDNCMFGNFAIASNGDVFFCARIGDLIPIANVRTSTIKEIYEKSLIAEKATIISNLIPCKDCELRYICGGGCRIEEFPELVKRTSFENFDISTVSPRKCSQKIKDKFYDLMIRSNKYFYTSL